MKKGLLIVYTGNGKGKTTAALGLAMRALGHGQKVCIVQFIKGSWKYGELFSAERFHGLLDFQVMGRGFTWKSEAIEKDRAIAREAWDYAKQQLQSQEYSLVILDELTYLITLGFVEQDEILNGLTSRREGLHTVVTGRNAPLPLIECADLVTEMLERKHPYQQGIKAQKGIEF
ncbi:cob(I)yrinic acid a,c-diamide adenosyltransferase [candidate division KSB3 bacterium]|uniref:Cob(I)yrinic acid a,c-diamide adenosyltransferase n=1 Tax=candidate division KSB3 bacterium TaxID=2044937 RepID=A0A2G6E6K6_9BACT|nr:MAG: cob(I)yrinic acid a,c-diamide adenosyltransferase [candidate division KSB3 bacterium]PIE30147.1 MAG: cob(I)yrinic acid a,c-diamide adenosyltransferase [candidate division KSB3 bacterium]